MDVQLMRYVGRIAEWNDEKGYGFVTPNGGGERAFVHVKAFEKRSRRPLDGDLISYEPVADDRRRLNAMRIRFVVARATPPVRKKDWHPRRAVGVLVLLAIAIAAFVGELPLIVPAIYAGMSLIAFFAYGLDKSAARTNRWRIQESTLHVLGLFCGWPGALIAQGSFRHKTRKFDFQVVFWLFVAVNLGSLAWLVWSGTIDHLHRFHG
jgi:uncharacterized membrane protein YsdA (DUF1294 family)/cold shock CspA family protein